MNLYAQIYLEKFKAALIMTKFSQLCNSGNRTNNLAKAVFNGRVNLAVKVSKKGSLMKQNNPNTLEIKRLIYLTFI